MAGAGDHNINISAPNKESRWDKWIKENLRGKNVDRSSEISQSSITPNENRKPKIGWVHLPMRDKYYEPSPMSIVLIHRSHQDYPGDHHKYRLAFKFIQENQINEVVACDKIFDIIKDLRECYDSKVKILEEDDHRLVWILFLDGCSSLGFIQCFISDDLRSFRLDKNNVSSIIRDLILLENQVPFRVLEILIDLSKDKNKLNKSILSFISFYSCVPITNEVVLRCLNGKGEKEKPAHLLDLLRLAACVHPRKSGDQKCSYDEIFPNYLSSSKLGSVQDLKWRGFQFRPSKVNSLKGITFSSSIWFAGYIYIPPITVNERAKTLLMNLVAYEKSGDTDCEVSSYLLFLKSLINDKEDVKELRSAGILYNNIGTDEEVVRFFSEIPTELVPNIPIDKDILLKLEERKRRRGRWMAEVWYKYFDSPWTIMALIAGGLALFLTTVQTWFTVFPNQ